MLTEQPQLITVLLERAIREMVDFLLDDSSLNNVSDKEQYENLYNRINKLTLKANTEGYFNYSHDNPHKTLADFLNTDDENDLIFEYYKIPTWTRKIMEQSAGKKIKKMIEWFFDQIGKVKPNIKL